MNHLRRSMVAAMLLTTAFAASAQAIVVQSYPIVTNHRLELTRAYCQAHYGLDSSTLVDPQIVVVHTTECATLKTAEQTFKSDVMEPGRAYLHKFGEVNVGVHFLVDRNGDIYSLLPLNVIGRHTIGLNYTAIGIENVGYADHLTPEQLKADTDLIVDLVAKLPSVRYLFGHYEYSDSKLPHYILYKEHVSDYQPTVKSDPGKKFMADLRRELGRFNVRLEN